MRHRKSGRHLTRTSAHRIAMRRNLAQSLFEHGEITTTVPKAKDVKPFVERLITLARDGSLRSRQRVIAMLNDRAIIPAEHQEAYEQMSDSDRKQVITARSGRRNRSGVIPKSYNKTKIPFVAMSVVHKLFADIGPRFKTRNGGYTRLVRLPRRRLGDQGEVALLQLVGTEEVPASGLRKASAGRRKTRAEGRRLFSEGKIVAKHKKPAAPAAN